jgi:hypothetical protein
MWVSGLRGALPVFGSPKTALSSTFLSGANKQLLMSSWAYVLEVITTRICAIGTGWGADTQSLQADSCMESFSIRGWLRKEKEKLWSVKVYLEAGPPQTWGLPGGTGPCHSSACVENSQQCACHSTACRILLRAWAAPLD